MREQPEKIDVKFLKGFIRRRKKIFLAVTSAIFAASVLFAYFSAMKVYVSTATFLIENRVPDDILKGQSTVPIEERLQSINQQILSRDKLLEIIRQYNLYGNPQDQENIESAIIKMREDIIVRTIRAEDLDKRPSRGRLSTIAFTLSFQGLDPETVQKVASRLASLYIEKNEQAKEQIVSQTSAVLQQRLHQLKDQAEKMDRKLSDFKRQHAGELTDAIPMNLEQIYRLNAQLDDLNGKISVLESQGTGSEAQFGAFGSKNSAGASPSVNDPWAHLTQMRMQLFNLRAKYSEKHPDVIKARKEIQQLEEKLGVTGEQNEKATGNPRDSELKRITKQRDDIQKKIAELTRRNQVAPMIQTEYHRLSADYDSTMKQYNDASMKLAEARAVREMDETQLGDRFIIIDQPVVPHKPENPKQTKIILAGFFLSIFSGLFVAIVIENLDHSIKSAEQLQKITKLPVLTVVPFIKNDEDETKSIQKQTSRILEAFKSKTIRAISNKK